jgi:hypothetical protein
VSGFEPQTPYEAAKYRRDKRSESRRKRVQGVLSTVGAVGGLTATGLVAAGKIKKIPRLVDAGYVTGTAMGGVGAASGLNFAHNQFKEAEEARREARRSFEPAPMSNRGALRKSCSEISKMGVAVPPDTEAWRMARPGGSDEWRQHVGPGALYAYEVPLAPGRRKAERYRVASDAMYGASGAGGVSIAALAARGRRGLAAGAAIPTIGLALGGFGARRKSAEHDLRSRKIRARGMQRVLDNKEIDKALVNGGFFRLPAGGVRYRRGGVRTPIVRRGGNRGYSV